jgi:acyl-CoA thioester hydrolase
MMSKTGMIPLLESEVQAEWLDYNGHMNDAFYAMQFSKATDELMALIGLGDAGRKHYRLTMYTLSILIHYRKEARLGEPLAVTAQILEHDDKRMRVWMDMRQRESGDVLAWSEQVLICIDQSGDAPRPAPFKPEMKRALEKIAAAQAHLPLPERAGQGISLKRKGPEAPASDSKGAVQTLSPAGRGWGEGA